MSIANILTGSTYEKVTLLPTCCNSVQCITEDPHYIETNIQALAYTENSNFILFSAPGAVGKSALAHYIAYKTGGIYWDLSKLVVGDHTFLGTMFESVGAERISEYIKGLTSKTTTLVIDAFDEAEMISGNSAILNLISDIYQKANPSETVFLFSRSETANRLTNYMNQAGITYSHYDIDYFNLDQAKLFIHNFLLYRDSEIKASHWDEKYYNSHIAIINDCIAKSLEQLEDSLEQTEDAVQFLGYAPVLETIAISIINEPNLISFLNTLDDNSSHFNTVQSILTRILEREHDKVINALKQKINDIPVSTGFFDNFYSCSDQISRLISFITMDEINTVMPDDCCSKEHYDLLSKKCEEVLHAFTNQHPFITYNTQEEKFDFIGTAFRDYVLANVILNPDIEFLAEEYYSTHHGIQSHLFLKQYLLSNNNRVKSHHFCYLQNALSSKLTTKDKLEIEVIECNEGVHCHFIISEHCGEEFDSAIEENYIVDVSDIGFVFYSITNLTLNAQVKVHIKCTGRDTRIENCNIVCNEIIVDGGNVQFENYNDEETSLSAKRINFTSSGCKFKILGTAPSFSAENIANYPQLYRYVTSQFSNGEMIDIEKFIHMIRSIFIKFRTHSKDMPAKDAEYIDFVILQANHTKKILFDFMYDLGIFFRDKHLYKINLQKMKEYGISMTALNNSDCSQLQHIYNEYIRRSKTN